jgi:hypothetical protein
MPIPFPSLPAMRRLAVLLALAAMVAACGGTTAAATFDPASPCPAEGQQPGAYPQLEALLPADYEGAAPDSVDSGRSCTAAALGSLADAGIREMRFAGATWQTGGSSGLTVALFEADGLDATIVRDFYRKGAEEARRTEKIATTDVTVGGRPAKRLDVLGSDGTGQTIVAWPGNAAGRVWVLLAADLGDTKVASALETCGSR